MSSLRKYKNNSGIILLIVLWTLTILTMLAVSLGRAGHVELSLAKYSIGKLKAKYLAWAGLIYAINQIRLDSEDAATKDEDTLYQCGVSLKENFPEDLFKEHRLDEGEGYFDINYIQQDSQGKQKVYYGLQDEERFININGLTVNNVKILISLITLLGFDEETAQTIAYSVLDWKDAGDGDALINPTYGAENDYYSRLSPSYLCKNAPFDSKEELLLVRGMTKEIFEAIKDYITVFPHEGDLKINFDTAPPIVFRAVARSTPDADLSNADSFIEKLLEYRSGDDKEEGTKDDQVVLEGMTHDPDEAVIFTTMSNLKVKTSNYFRVSITGVDEMFNVQSTIEAVVNRGDRLNIVYWRYQ